MKLGRPVRLDPEPKTINGDGGCGWQQPNGGLAAQVNWLGLSAAMRQLGAESAFHRVNSQDGCGSVTVPS